MQHFDSLNINFTRDIIFNWDYKKLKKSNALSSNYLKSEVKTTQNHT